MARSNYLIALVIVAALALTLSLLTFVASAKTAQASFPGSNGLIAFVSDRHGNDEIYVMNPDGSAPTRLTTHSAQDTFPAVSPNGKEIVFASTRHDPDPNSVFYNENRDLELYVMDAKDDVNNKTEEKVPDGEGDNLRRLTNNTVADANPSWSPEGKKVVFTNGLGVNGEVYVMDAEDKDEDGNGDEQTNLTNYPGFFDGQPVFSPDGTRIAFTSTRAGTNDIWIMNSDGSNPTSLTNGTSSDAQPEFSPLGTKVAFHSNRLATADDTVRDFDIYVMDAEDRDKDHNGDNQTNLTNANGVDERYPAWSPDANMNQIAFYSGTSPGSDIMVMNAQDGTGQKNLTINQENQPAGDVFPDWGPQRH